MVKLIYTIILVIALMSCAVEKNVVSAEVDVFLPKNTKLIVVKKPSSIYSVTNKKRILWKKTKVYHSNVIYLIKNDTNYIKKRVELPFHNYKIDEIHITHSGKYVVLVSKEDSIYSLSVLNVETTKIKSYTLKELANVSYKKILQYRVEKSNLGIHSYFGWYNDVKITSDSTFSLNVANPKNLSKDTTYIYKFE